ncbi:MAG: autotransporter-associated beta strand repeat-containing protein [Chthoniobacteraceae bacterium]
MSRVILSAAVAFFVPQVVKGATLIWDADGTSGAPTGGTGLWDQTGSNLWDLAGVMQAWSNAANHIASFGGTAGTVTLGEPITAGGLLFNTTDYTIAGNTLTLGVPSGSPSPVIAVGNRLNATISSSLAGANGLTKVGKGTLTLASAGNTYTGDTVINDGTIVITNENQLGTSTTTISINGIAQTGQPGFSGGQLTVNGVSPTGPVTITREIGVSGRGPGAFNVGGGLLSIGNNVFNGDINIGGPASEARISASHGVTTINGDIYLGASAGNGFFGNGNIIVNGQVSGFDTGTDRFFKTGNIVSSTLWLQNAANDFRETLRIDSGTVRVSDNGALGVSTTSRAIDLNNGRLEIHTDAPNFDTRNVHIRAVTGLIYATRQFDGNGLNQTVNFGNLELENGTLQFDNRNGYGLRINAQDGAGGTTSWSGAGNAAFTNNADGRLTFDGTIRKSDATARTFTVGGNGNTMITGSYLGEGGGAHVLTKNNNGILWIQGTASTYTGATNVNAGTLSIGSFGAINNNAVALNFGATTVTAALEYTGAADTLTKPISLAGTTGGANILANGTGAVTISADFGAGGGGIKTLLLGGTNTDANTISGVIRNNSGTNTTALAKFQSGTWLLTGANGSNANGFTGGITISDGTLQIQDTGGVTDVLKNGGSITFGAHIYDNSAGGTFEYLGDGANASAETVGTLSALAGAGTVKVTAGAGGTAALTFSSLGAVSAGGGIDFITNAGGSVVLTAAGDTNGILNAHLFINGADFASGSAVTAATYTLADTGASLTAGNTTPYLVNTMDIGAQATASINAGIKFNDTRNFTLASGATVTLNNGGGAVSGGILVTGGSSVVISGGTGITSGGAADLVFRTDGPGDSLTLNTPIAATTTGGWTKLGAGALVIGAANANTTAGAVNINEGTVQLATGAKLGADSIDVNLRQGATLDLNGVNLGTVASGVGSLDFLNGAGIITNSAAATVSSIRVGNANTSSLFTGTISDGAGQVALVKNGSGSFRLQGAQNFSGGVTITGGNLYVTSLANYGDPSGIGTGLGVSNADSLVFNGGSLFFTGSDGTFYQPTDTPSVSINRLFTLAGNGTIYSQGRFGGPNRENVASGSSLVFNNPGDVAFSGAGTRDLQLRGDSTGDNEMNLRLTNNPNANEALSLTKQDASLWILTNAGNDYTGNTTIINGVLRVGEDVLAARTMPTTSALVLGSTTGTGVLQTKGLFDRPISPTTTPVAGSVTWNSNLTTGGGGFAASTAPLVVNLGGAGATLQWGGTDGFLPTGTGNGARLFLSSNTSWADVDFQNGIDLNGAKRTVQVDDNGFTGLDYATISGNIIDTGVGGALDFTGGGPLILTGANSYTGDTRILSSGTLIVSSIGNATGTTSSSIGASGGTLRLTGNTTVQLAYVGAGETATRPIVIDAALSASRTFRIDSGGSGPLVLTDLTNNKTGAFLLLLELRGQNTDANMITSVLGNGLAGSGATGTRVTKTDGGTWILNPTSGPNTFSDELVAASGSLGLTADGIGSASLLRFSNASIFAFGGPLVTSVPVFVNNNTNAGFVGPNSITLNGDFSKVAGVNDIPVTNSMDSGAVLTINGNYINLQTTAGTRLLQMRGFGDTVWNGLIQDNSATSLTRLDIRIGDNANFTLGGDNKAAALGMTGGLVLGQGTLIVNHAGGLGPVANIVDLSGGRFTSAIELSGASAIQNLVRLSGDQATIAGSQNIELAGAVALMNSGANRFLLNELIPGKTLTISGALSLSNDNTGRTLTVRGSGVTQITGVVQNGGTGNGGLAFSGIGSLELTNAATATGALTVNRELVILSGANGSWNNGGFTLNPTGIIRLDNSGGNNVMGRLSNSSTFTGQGGTLDIIGFTGGSSHSAGALTINSVQTYITVDDDDGTGPGTAPVDLTFASLNFTNSGSSLNLIGVPSLGTTNKVLVGTFAGSANPAVVGGNIMTRAFIGNDFATYDAVDGMKAFTGYDGTNNLAFLAPVQTTTTGSRTSASAIVTLPDTTGVTPFMAITGGGIPAGTYVVSVDSPTQLTLSQNATSTSAGAANFIVNEIHVMNLTANVNLSAESTRDALKINGNALTVSGSNNSTLTLTGAAILNTGGDNTLSIPQVSFTTGPVAYIQVAAGTTLDVGSTLIGGNSWAKAQGGTLMLNTPTFITGTTNILNGTVVLNAPVNAMFPNQLLNINAGATLDLNGNVQFSGYLLDPGVLPGTGGSITTTGGPALLVANQSTSATFASVISGAVSYAKLGASTLTLESVQTYTGTTTLMGGTLALQDEASISATSSIQIRNATLLLNNNGSLQTSVSDRINDATPIALRDGTLNFTGKVQDMTTETLGAVSVFKGANTITVNTGGIGSGAIATAQLTIASLTRSPGTTINFTGTNLGAEGNNSKLIITTPLTPVGKGVLGAWAIGNTSEYAAYNQTNGVGWVGYGGFVGYDAGFAPGNITSLGMSAATDVTTTLPAGTATTSLLRFHGGFVNNLEFTNPTDVLNLELGGILRSNNNNPATIGTPAVPGVISSGTSELVVYNNQNTITINAVIQGATALVKSGAATLTLTNANTYTLGTTVAQGTLRLEGGLFTTVVPAGGLQINNAVVTMVTNNGQIDATNIVTLTGSSTLTLAGGAGLDNTLNSLVFDNTAGTSTPTVSIPTGSVLTLTSSTPVTVTTNNALTLPTITGGTLAISSGVNTISVEAPNIDGRVYTGIHRALNIASVITGIGSSITKSGEGLVQLSGQSTFTGGINVTGGGLVLGTSSTGTTANSLASGPLGRGDVTMATGTRLFVDDNTRTVANAFSFASDPIFDNIGTSTDTLTVNGNLTFATLGTTGLVVNIATPYLNVVLGGKIIGLGSVTAIGGATGANTITKAGIGNIPGLNITGISPTATINIEGLTNLNSFTLLHDGDGTSSVEAINLGTVTFEPVNGLNLSLTIGRAGSGLYFPLSAYKTLALTGLTSSVLPNGITLANNNNYGLNIPDNITLASGNNWTVNNANTSLQPVGLTLSGIIGGSQALTMSGNGVMKLANAANSFIGTINITNGTVEAGADGAFGDSANVIQIGSNSLAEGLRISATFGTSRTINLNAASSGIDVTGSNVFTLNTAFTTTTATNALRKNDLGTLVLTQAQPGWDGVLTIGQGVLRITDGAALGTATGNLVIANVGASLELPGGITVADAIQIASTNNSSSNGVNASGAIHSTGGINTLTGAITIDTTTTDANSRSGTLTADLGSTLNVEGGIVLGIGTAGSNRDNWVGFGGAGTINLTTTAITHTGNLVADGLATLTKFGSGTLNIQLANAYTGDRVVVKTGTLSLNGPGTFGVPGAGGGTGDVYLNPTGLLVLDNSGTAVDNRLTGRNINISGADLTIIGNSSAPTSETVGTFTLREGTSYFTLDADPDSQLNFTTGAVTRSAQATLVVRGDNLGAAAAAGVATIKGGAYVFIGQLGDSGTTNKSILPWAYGDTSLTGEGTFFLTADSAAAAANTAANSLRALTGAEQTTDFTSALANVNLSSTEALSSLTTVNSLRLGSGGGVLLNYVPLTLDSGGLIVLGGNTGITGFSGVSYLTSTSNREINIHTVGDLTLTVPIAGTTGTVTKSGPGTLTLTAGNTNHGTVMVNDGILKLGGGDQTILPGRQIYVNEGGVLDLNGTVQQVILLESRQSAVLARNDAHFGGGTVINSAGTQATLAMTTASSIFAGSIQGNIAVVRSNNANTSSDWNLYVDQPYTGPTLYNGGRVILQDTASLSGTTAIELSNATFLITSNNNATEASNLTDRINDAATISLRGGMLQLRSRAALYTTETFGAVTLGEGNSIIDFAEGGSNVNQVDATFASFSRAPGSRGTVRFVNIDAQPSGLQRIFITTLNGSSTASIGGGLTNDLIGGWATFEREFASYIPGQGVGGLTTQGFAGYAPNVLDEGLATDNIRIVLPVAGSTTTLTGDRTVNSLNMQAPSTSTDDSTLDLGGNTLTLASGGLILSPVSTTALFNNIAVLNGNLTAGTTASPADLYLHAQAWFNGQVDLTGNADVRIGANIVDNGAGGPVTLVIDGATGRGAAFVATNDVFLNGSNTYTGGTFVNAGQVQLNNPSAEGVNVFAIPGDLTIAGGYGNNSGALFNDRTTTVLLNFDSQINETATVTIMGGGILNLNGNNQTIANLVFNNHGGTVPQVTSGTGKLTVTGSGITASGQNVSVNATSTIDGGLAFTAATTTITVHPVEWNGTTLNPILPNLIVNAAIEGGDIIKDGNGVLRLSGANAWTGNFDLQTGGLLLGNNTVLSAGTLTIGNNTFLSSTADNRVIPNNFTVTGDFALRDVFSLTLNGASTLAAGNHNINVEAAAKTLTLGGILDGAGSITKTGNGILVLSNNSNSYSGATTVNDGVLSYGGVDAVPTGTALSVSEGALVDITGGGSAVTVGSLASNSATQGGVIINTAASGTVNFTAGNSTNTGFGGVMAAIGGATFNFVKTGTGTLTLGGANQYNGSTTVVNGRLVAKAVGGSSPLGTSQSLIMGGGSTSGTLQLGDSAAALDHTFTSLASAGTGTANRIVSGNSGMSTLTLNLPAISVFSGNIGGAGLDEGNLNLVKDGPRSLVINGSGTSTYVGTTTVAGGKLFMASTGAFPAMTTNLTVADDAQFALTGTSNVANQVYGFSGAGNVVTVGTTTGGTLGFGIDGGFNTKISLPTTQTLTANGTMTTAVYVNGTPSAASYVLIDGADLNSLAGTFDLNPYVFNGGAFTYALAIGGTAQQLILTPTAATAAADAYWKGDLTGLGTAVWSATLSGTSNWDTGLATSVDTQVAPDSGTIVHFTASGAANFDTTLGSNMTIESLIFHTANPATTIASSNGVNTLTLGNGVDTPSLTIETGAANVAISAIVGLPQSQSWNIEDAGRTLTLSGGLTGTGVTLTVNDTATVPGDLVFSGTAGTIAGVININAGNLIFEGTGSLSSNANVALGTAATAATLKVGNATAATNATIGGLSNGAFAGSKVIGGNATISTLSIGAASGSATFTGALGGGGANENNFNLEKTGGGTQILDGAATYTGTTVVRDGILQLGPVSTFTPVGAVTVTADANTTATFDLNGKNYTAVGDLTLGGGVNGIAQFLDTALIQGTLTLPGNIVFNATNDPGQAVIGVNIDASGGSSTITVGDSVNAAADLTLNGTYTVTSNNSLSFAGAGSGVINGDISILNGAGTTKDVNFNSTGTWTVNAKIQVTDTISVNTGVVNATAALSLDAVNDIVIDGTGTQGSAIVNISAASQVHTGDDIFIRNGGQINVLTTGGIGTGTDLLNVGDTASTTAGSAALLNLVSANIAPTQILVGNGTNIGNITGTGIITTTGNKDIRHGSIGSGITLAGNGQIFKQTTGTLVFSGDRDVASTGNVNVREGDLVLDYTTNNNSKIGRVLLLGLGALQTNASLILNGNASAPTVDSVTSTTILQGATTVALNNDPSQTLTLDLGNAFTRTVTGGAVLFEYSTTDAKATSTSPAGALGWATVKIGAGLRRIAAVDGSGDIVQATLAPENDPTLWVAGQNIINSGNFTGIADACSTISSLTFAAATASTLNIASGARFGITSGGILVDPGLGAVDMRITGGELYGNVSNTPGEFMVHQNNTLGSLIIASNIIESSGITKTGVGTLILSGNNSFLPTGSQITINAGKVQATGGNAIGDTTNIQLRAGTTLELTTSAEVIGNILDESSGTIALGTSGQLTINETANADYRGVFTGGTNSVLTLNAINSTGTTFNWNVTGQSTTGFVGSVNVNNGLLQLSTSTGRLANAKAFTINKGGSLLIDDTTTSRSGDRILNTATIALNSADGVSNGVTQPRGLWIRTDQDGTLDETVGVVTANSGASYVTMESTSANDDSDIIMTNLVRANNATLNVRGTNLGSTNATNNQFRIGNAGNQTSFISLALVGGGGAAASQSVSIVPWAIGETYTAGISATINMGNSLVTYVSGAGIRPLDLTTEYDTLALAAANENARESLTADPAAIAGKTINSLVINKNSTGAGTISVTGTGAGQTMINTSGTFLFTQNTGAAASSVHGIVLSGFDGGIQTGGSEYVMFVVNPSSAANTATLTAAVASPLNTVGAALTKSGRGTLEIGAVNTYGGGTTINEGAILLHANANLGGGAVTLSGGTLQIAVDYVDDLGGLTTPTLNVLSGGGTIDTGAITVVATGLGITGSAGSALTKIGTGILQLAGGTASTFTGDFGVRRGTLELNKTPGVNGIGGGNLLIGFSTTASETGTVKLLADNQIADSTNVSVRSNTTGAVGTLDLNTHADTIGSLTMGTTTGSGVLVRTGAGGVLTVTGDITLSNDRNTNDTGTNPRGVLITGTGTTGVAAPNSGTLNLGGGIRTITVQPNSLTVATTVGKPDALIETIVTNGGIIKEGSRVLFLSGTNTYAGSTTINNGAISISSADGLGDGSATNTIAINNGGILQTTGASVDLGVNRTISLGGSGGSLEVTGSNLLTAPGVISGVDCAVLAKIGTGTLMLTGANNYDGTTSVLEGILNIQNSAALGTTVMGTSVASGATLQLEGGITIGAEALTLSGNGAAGQNGALVNVSGTNEFGGPIMLGTTSTIASDSGMLSLTDAGTITGAGFNLFLTGAGDGAIGSGIATTTGAVSKAGAGTWTLSGTNTYTGFTAITAGTLQFANRVSLYNATPANWVDTNILVAPGATAAFNVGGATEFTSADIGIIAALGSPFGGFSSGSSLALDTTNASGGNFDHSAVIADPNAGANTLNLVKLGAGRLTLLGANSYTGTTTVNSGVLRVGAAGVIPDGSALTINASAAFDLAGFNETIGSLAGSGLVQNSLPGAAILTAGGNGANTVFSGQITDNTALVKIGTGELSLTGSTSTFTGGVTVNGGSLSIGASSDSNPLTAGPLGTGTLTIADAVTIIGAATSVANAVNLNGSVTIGGTTAADDLTLGGTTTLVGAGVHTLTVTAAGVTTTISGQVTGPGDLAKAGAGTLVLSNALNDYAGSTTVSGGLLRLGAADVIPDGSALTVDGGATVDIVGNSETVGSLAGAGLVQNSGAGAILTAGGNGASTVFSGQMTGFTALIKAGAGSLSLSGATSTFTGGVFLTQGALVIGASSDSGPLTQGPLGTGALVLSDGVTITGASTSVANAVTVSGDVSIGGTSAGDNLTLSGTVDLGGSTRAIAVSDAAVTATLSGAVTGSGSAGLTKAGAGTLVLSGTGNSWTGDTTIDAGIVRVGAVNVIPDGSGLAISAGTFDLDGNAETVGGLSGAGTVTNSHATANATLTVNYNGGTDSTFSGQILNGGGTGMLDFVKSGTGKLILSGTNTYKGSTAINGGILSIGASNNLGDSTVATNTVSIDGSTLEATGTFDLGANRTVALGAGGGTIKVTTGNNLTVSGVVSGATALTKTDDGTLTLSGVNINSGTVEIFGGTVSISDSTNLGDSSVGNDVLLAGGTLEATGTFGLGTNLDIALGAGGGTIKVTSGNLLIASGVVSGSTTMTKTDDGVLVFSNPNTNSGLVAINGGKISIRTSVNLGDESATNTLSLAGGTLRSREDIDLTSNRTVALGAGGGTFEVDDMTTMTVPGVISGSSTLSKTGDGTLILSGTNTNSGLVDFSAGITEISASRNLGDESVTNTLAFAGGTLKSTGASVDLTSNRSVALNTGGGTFRVTGSNTLTVSGAISGSTGLNKTDTGTLALSGDNTGFAGVMNIKGGTVVVGSSENLGGATGVTFDGAGATLAVTGTGTLASSAGLTFTTSATIDVAANRTLDYAGSLGGASGFTKAGAGTMLVSSDNSAYSGPTTINAGTFGGTGKTGGDVNVDAAGTFSPGASIGTFAVGGGLLLADGGTFRLEILSDHATLIDSMNFQNTSDLAMVTGALTLGPTTFASLAVSDTNGGASTLVEGDYLTFITYATGSWTGVFDVPGFGNLADYDVSQTDPVYFYINGTNYAIDYNYSDPHYAGVSSVALVVVPEPGAMGSLAAAAGLLLGLQRFRRRNARG